IFDCGVPPGGPPAGVDGEFEHAATANAAKSNPIIEERTDVTSHLRQAESATTGRRGLPRRASRAAARPLERGTLRPAARIWYYVSTNVRSGGNQCASVMHLGSRAPGLWWPRRRPARPRMQTHRCG